MRNSKNSGEVTRREFVRGAASAGALLSFAPRTLARTVPYPIAFSTLGCPKWKWETILANAKKWGYAAIELRVLEGELDLAKRPEFADSRLAQTLQQLEEHRLKISDLGSSAELHEPEGPAREKQLDAGKKFIELAHKLRTPYVRVFGNKILPDQPKQASVDRVIAGMKTLAEFAKGSNVGVIIESHGDFTDSETLRAILDGVALPNAGLLWDVHHTVFYGKEKPQTTFERVGKYVWHTHLKDSRPDGKGKPQYVRTGEGTIGVQDAVATLVKGGYKGFYCFEWEKQWIPELEEPEEAFPRYAETMRKYLQRSGWIQRNWMTEAPG